MEERQEEANTEVHIPANGGEEGAVEQTTYTESGYTQDGDQVLLSWKALYENLEVKEYYPLKKFAALLKKLSSSLTQAAQLTFDFSGIEQLTDLVFCVMDEELNTLRKGVKAVHCNGCIHLTDVGVFFLAKAFQDLEHVSFDGCPHLTDESLKYLQLFCTGLQHVSVSGTSVGYIPTSIGNACKITVDGCPLYDPAQYDNSTFNECQRESQGHERKLVVFRRQDCDYKFTEFLRTGKFERCDNEQELTQFGNDYLSNFSLSNSNSVSENDVEFLLNVIETKGYSMSSDSVPFTTESAAFVLLIDFNSADDLQLKIMNKIDVIRGHVNHAPIMIVILYEDSPGQTTAGSIEEQISRLNLDLDAQLKQTAESLKQHLAAEHWSKVNEEDFEYQERYKRSLYTAESRTVYTMVSVDVKTLKMQVYGLQSNVIEEGQATSKEEELNEFLTNHWNRAMDKLQSLAKSDISELKSYSKPPVAVIECTRALCILLNQRPKTVEDSSDASKWWPTAKKLISSFSFLRDMHSYELDTVTEEQMAEIEAYINDERFTESKIAVVSNAGVAFHVWVHAVYAYGKIKYATSKESNVSNIIEYGQGAAFLLSRLSALCSNAVGMNFEQSLEFSGPFMDISKAFPNHRICSLDKLVSELKEKPFGANLAAYAQALSRLDRMGKVVFLKDTPEQYVVTDIQWFLNLSAQLYKIEGFKNLGRVKSLSSEESLLSMADLRNVIGELATDEEFSHWMSIMFHDGGMLKIPYCRLHPEDPPFLLALFVQLQPKPYLYLDGASKDRLSEKYFHENYFPHLNSKDYNPDDLRVSLSYRFTNGYSGSLLGRIISDCLLLGDVMYIWSTGVLCRKGAMEILIKRNVHAVMVTNQFDIEARCTCPPGGQKNIVLDYIWATLSTYLLIVDYHISRHPSLHVKITIPCQGKCASEATPHLFSPTEFPKSLQTSHFPVCPNQICGTTCELKLMHNYQPFLPYHDWCESYDPPHSCCWCDHCLSKGGQCPQNHIGSTWRCNCAAIGWKCANCGICRRCVAKLWKMQSSLSPSFMAQHQDEQGQNFQGTLIDFNLLRKKSMASEEHFSIKHPGVLSHDYQTSIYLTVFKPGSMVLQVVEKQSTDVIASVSLEAGEVSTGDKIKLQVTGEQLDEDQQSFQPYLEVLVNDRKTFSGLIPSGCGLKFQATESSSTTDLPVVTLHWPTVPVVTSRHFSPGQLVMFKTSIGSQWAVSEVQQVSDDQLVAADGLTGEISAGQVSPVLTPTGDANIIISETRDMVRDSRQLYKYLDKQKGLPAPFGLFPRVQQQEPQVSALSIHKRWLQLDIQSWTEEGARYCTVNHYHPAVLEQCLNYRLQHPNVLDTGYSIVLLPAYQNGLMKWTQPARHDIHKNDHYAVDIRFGYNKILEIHENLFLIRALKHQKLDRKEFLLLFESHLSQLLFNYDKLYRSRPVIQNKQWLFPEDVLKEESFKPYDLPDPVFREGLDSIVSVYRATGLLLAAINAKTADLFESRKLDNGKPVVNPDVIQLDNSLQNALTKIPDYRTLDIDFESDSVAVTDLQHLQVSSSGLKIPDEQLPFKCGSLITLTLKMTTSDGHALPESFVQLKDSLRTLKLTDNPLEKFPGFLTQFTSLSVLVLANTLIQEVPDDIGNLLNLTKLDLTHTLVSNLPPSFAKLKNLRQLHIKGIKLPFKDPLHCTAFLEHDVQAYSIKDKFDQLSRLVKQYDANNKGVLTGQTLADFRKEAFSVFPRFKPGPGCEGGFPEVLFHCTKLRSLSFCRTAIQFLPDGIERLSHLEELNLDHNPYLESLSPKVGKLPLQKLMLESCPRLSTPPPEIIHRGAAQTIAYMKRLQMGSMKYNKTKLMFVGLGGAGKTSLMRSLMSNDFKSSQIEGEAITDGIDINMWTVKHGDQEPITYSVWDFAGQTLYYNTHQFFLSKRAIYVLVWNTRLGYEHAGLDFWLHSIACHAPKAPVFIVGTHADKIAKADIPSESIEKKFPSIAGFYTVSSLTGQGIDSLLDEIINVTMKQSYIGKQFPIPWIKFETAIMKQRGTKSVLLWQEVQNLAEMQGIHEAEEVTQAVGFLHDLGTLHHFENEFLSDKVVINPQWIVDVMACIVSVHNSVIKDGRLQHSDIGVIWKDYPEDLHQWLLKLTEVFNLTFPLSEEETSIVPCLLPQKQPQIDWPEKMDKDERELKIIYQFDYLPAGLFNRVQVRLSEFSDTSAIWKTGSILQKNGHLALLSQQDNNQVLVKAQGVRPENFLLLVHEIFESLIEESFQGVSYEYLLPCMDCLRSDAKDPTLFSSNVLHRAIDKKALFLQCHNFFHTLSIAEVQANMPPDSDDTFDLNFQDTVRDLNSLQDKLGYDACFLFCKQDLEKTDGCDAAPICDIEARLVKAGFKCWLPKATQTPDAELVATEIQTSKVALIFISCQFVKDSECQRLFQYVNDSLKKPFILLMVDPNRDWLKSDIGMQVAEKVYLNFSRPSLFEESMKELVSKLRLKTKKKKGVSVASDCFISYCWTNSASALKMGQVFRPKEGAIGNGDPREIKEFLEKNGINCWLDVERVGENGLFEDIAEGLKNTKVVVACVSDEYALSANCQMEFRFAHVALRKPIILAVVGTGFQWAATEVGMLSLGYHKFNFQAPSETSHDQLLSAVREQIQATKAEEAVSHVPTSSKTSANPSSAFQELYELAQRKILRQISGYVDDAYPRLFLIDLCDNQSEGQNRPESDTEVAGTDESPKEVLKPTSDKVQYCLRLLCEYEGGWHCEGKPVAIPLVGEYLDMFFPLTSPYLARIMTVIKHSSIDLNCFHGVQGEHLLDMLEKNAGVVDVESMKPVYIYLRQFLINSDLDKTAGGLRRCQQASGKIVWLCPEHQELPRVSVLHYDTSDFPLQTPHSLLHYLKLLSTQHMLKTSSEEAGLKPDKTNSPRSKTQISQSGTSLVGHNPQHQPLSVAEPAQLDPVPNHVPSPVPHPVSNDVSHPAAETEEPANISQIGNNPPDVHTSAQGDTLPHGDAEITEPRNTLNMYRNAKAAKDFEKLRKEVAAVSQFSKGSQACTII
ncbi:uncharacterized protein LOC106176900 [Lingula anatina]|uniref:non-specific serine/threonine protein kinase n=1 Tax=Lingula anatina TaxID=7574 RepID=A0A1S3JWY2_LINAN|nr:uncharacterized protein LOC106176900 [Lingula anatina]XP_013414941.1 uncharacterized protein LOC106176900 [Lingula anatina]|eukprot:XP_013414940.1 uncharacterized protein LOC106176900 [Lingula anatina]